MPRDTAVLRALDGYRRRFRFAELSLVVIATAAVAGIVLAGTWALATTPATSRAVTLAAFSLCAVGFGTWSWRRWTTACVAALIESRQEGLDNLVVTAEEMARQDNPSWHPTIEAEVTSAAIARLANVSSSVVQPLALPLTLGVGALAALASLLVALTVGGRPGTASVSES